MIKAFTLRKSLFLAWLRTAETSLMLWSQGNSFIKSAALFGSCKDTSQKQVLQKDLERTEQCLYQL